MKRIFIFLLSCAGFWLVVFLASDVSRWIFGRPIMNDYILHIINLSLVYVIFATSLNLINGFTGLFSLGHMGFAAVGAYTSAIVTTLMMKLDPGNFWHYGIFAVALISGGISAAVAGFLIGFPSLRLRGDYLAIVTLGFGEIIRTILNNIDYVGGPRGLTGIPKFSNFTIILIVAVATIVVIRNLVFSTHGRALLSIRENELAAELCGINTTRYKIIAFMVGAFFSGIGGSLLAHLTTIAHPTQYGFMGSVMVLIMVYVGGMGSISGSVIAAFVLTFMSEGLRSVITTAADVTGLPIGDEWRMVLYALLLILVMIFKTSGIMGMKEVKLLVPEEEHS